MSGEEAKCSTGKVSTYAALTLVAYTAGTALLRGALALGESLPLPGDSHDQDAGAHLWGWSALAGGFAVCFSPAAYYAMKCLNIRRSGFSDTWGTRLGLLTTQVAFQTSAALLAVTLAVIAKAKTDRTAIPGCTENDDAGQQNDDCFRPDNAVFSEMLKPWAAGVTAMSLGVLVVSGIAVSIHYVLAKKAESPAPTSESAVAPFESDQKTTTTFLGVNLTKAASRLSANIASLLGAPDTNSF